MGTIILRLISLPVKQHLWLLLLFCSVTVLKGQSPASLQLDANTIESACAGNGHVISMKVNGGQAPYTYSWQDGAQGSFRKDLPSGTYSCTVRDANGASATKQFHFKPQPAALEVKYSQQKSADGSARLSIDVTGGKAPYTYFWMGAGIDIDATRNKKELGGLKEGEYQVVVQDTNKCTASVTVNIK